MENGILKQIIQLFSKRIGICVGEQDVVNFQNSVTSCMKSLMISDAAEYYYRLNGNNTASNLEWSNLITQITIGETYFFRDIGQMELLKNWILPKLIDRRKEGNSVRIWSAGCSTGEEPYSIAILLDEHMPGRWDCDISILGTDISENVLEKAKLGIYSDWALRGVSSKIKEMYFHRKRKGWELDERIRKMVTFKYHNLIKNDLPAERSEIYNIDLVICRNVLIYFDSKTIANVLGNISSTLSKEGFLMTGHAELCGQKLDNLRTMIFPESIIYQRVVPLEPQVVSLTERKTTTIDSKVLAFNTDTQITEARSRIKTQEVRPEVFLSEAESQIPGLSDPQSEIAEAEELFKRGSYAKTIKKLEPIVNSNNQNDKASYLLARSYANHGDYANSVNLCNAVLKTDKFSVKYYFLLAQIEEVQGNREEATKLLKKVLYLDSTFIPAYLELGALYEFDNNPVRAKKMRTTALKLLKTLLPQAVVDPYDDMAADKMILYVQRMAET